MIMISEKLLKFLQYGLVLSLLLFSFAAIAPSQAEDALVIEYWQPTLANMPPRIEAIDMLIAEFETLHPDIQVVHRSDLPSAATNNLYEPGVGLALRAGQGPDVVTLFNGWIPAWISAGYLVPLPEDIYTEAYIQENFYPIVNNSRYDGRYWALPTAVRTMGLFYNRDYFAMAGIEEPNASWTWDDFAEAAAALNGVQENVVGFDWELNGWGHHWLREVLVPQFGGSSYVDNPNQSIWGSAEACEAFTWALGLEAAPRNTVQEAEDGVGYPFLNGLSAMHVDGSFRITTIDTNAPDLNYGIAPLPSMMQENGEVVQRTFGSYWTHGLTPHAQADSERYEAALLFLDFITSAHAGLVWSSLNAELPAQRAAASEAIAANPLIEPFIESLDFSYATPFVNETQQRNFLSAAYNSVLAGEADPCDALRQVDQQEQELIEDFLENRQRWELGADLIPIGVR